MGIKMKFTATLIIFLFLFNISGVTQAAITKLSVPTSGFSVSTKVIGKGAGVVISWKVVSGAVRYQVDRSDNASFVNGSIGISVSGIQSNSWVDTRDTAGKSIYYRVRAITARGEVRSKVVLVKTPAGLVKYGNEAISWLAAQQDGQKQAKYPLVRSYYIPSGDPYSVKELGNQSWIYDDALAVIAFSIAGEQERAKNILIALQQLQNTDGSLDFSYDVNDGQVGTIKRSGSMAWVGYATAFYEKKFNDSQFKPFAQSWLIISRSSR